MKEKKEKTSVLVAIPTNIVKYYCLGKLIQSLRALEIAGEIVFADDTHHLDRSPFGNTAEPDKYAKILEKYYKVIHIDKTKSEMTKPRIRQRLVNARNTLREYFLSTNHTHMLFIDSDVIVPKDTIPRLISAKGDIVSGIYWQNQKHHENNATPKTVVYKYLDNESYLSGVKEYAMPLTIDDLIPSRVLGKDYMDIHIAAIGFGCVLLSRKLLEDKRWEFRWKSDEPERPTTEDMWWSIDVVNLGYEILAHTGVLCKHYPKAWVGAV